MNQNSNQPVTVDKTVPISVTLPESIHANIWEEVRYNIANNGGFTSFSSVLTKRLREAKQFIKLTKNG